MAIRKFSTASIKSGTKSSKFWDQTTYLTVAVEVAVEPEQITLVPPRNVVIATESIESARLNAIMFALPFLFPLHWGVATTHIFKTCITWKSVITVITIITNSL